MSELEVAQRVIASEQLYADCEGYTKAPLLLQVYEPQHAHDHDYTCQVELSFDGELLRSCPCPGVTGLQALIQGLNFLQINLNSFIKSRRAVLYMLYYKDEEKREPVYGEVDFRVIFQNIEYY